MSQESPLMEKIRMAKIRSTDLRRFDDGVNMLREMIAAVLIEHDALAARVSALEKRVVLHDIDEAKKDGALDEEETAGPVGTPCPRCGGKGYTLETETPSAPEIPDNSPAGLMDEMVESLGDCLCQRYRNEKLLDRYHAARDEAQKPAYERRLNYPDELPKNIKQAVDEWIEVNQQDASKLRYGIIPLGAAGTWIYAMNKANAARTGPRMYDEATLRVVAKWLKEEWWREKESKILLKLIGQPLPQEVQSRFVESGRHPPMGFPDDDDPRQTNEDDK